jgi:flavin reductase (DIM6/NTAB) family NADH-FMN oxidoreductase RutF
VQRHDVGDHILFLGQVEAYEHQEQVALLYVQGKYAKSATADLLIA